MEHPDCDHVMCDSCNKVFQGYLWNCTACDFGLCVECVGNKDDQEPYFPGDKDDQEPSFVEAIRTDDAVQSLFVGFLLGCCLLIATIIVLPIGLVQMPKDDASNKVRAEMIQNQTTQCQWERIEETRECTYTYSRQCDDEGRCSSCTGKDTQYLHVGYAPFRCGYETPLSWWSTGCPSSERSIGPWFTCYIEPEDCHLGMVDVEPMVSEKRTSGQDCITAAIVCGSIAGALLCVTGCLLYWTRSKTA